MSSDDLQRGALAIVLAAAGASCCCIASVHLLPQCSWQRCAWLLSGHTARSGVGDGDDEPSDAAAATVTVALVQAASEMGAVSANISRLEKAIRQAAADHGAKIMVLPETAVTGYLSQDLAINWHVPGRPLDRRYDMTRSMDPHKFAEQQNGPSVRHFAELARELGVYITVPFIETSAEGNNEEGPVLYNAVSLVGPESDKAVAHYRKNCPWPDPEKSWASVGDGVSSAVYKTPWGTVGLGICFDIHTILAKYDDEQLWALLYPIGWVGDTRKWFGELLPANLDSCSCPHFILGANWATVSPPDWQGAGGSTVFGPGGEIVAQAEFGWREQIVTASIPTQRTMGPLRRLDLTAYAAWGEKQPGTDYWTASADADHSFARDVRRLKNAGVEQREGLSTTQHPWRPRPNRRVAATI